jgi:hypothetical protein
MLFYALPAAEHVKLPVCSRLFTSYASGPHIFRSCCRDTARVVTNTNPLTHRHPPKALKSSYNEVNYI